MIMIIIIAFHTSSKPTKDFSAEYFISYIFFK